MLKTGSGLETRLSPFPHTRCPIDEAIIDHNDSWPFIFAGYANELGEAFRNMIRLWFIYFSYAVSSGYVVSHAIAKGLSTRPRREQNNVTSLKSGSTSDRVKNTHTSLPSVHHKFGSLSTQKQNQLLSPAYTLSAPVSTTAATVDTLLWQGLASVVIPGLTINRLCAGSRVLFNRYTTKVLSRQVRQWLVKGVGLCCIPLIIHPIDW